MSALDGVDPETRELLERYGFDSARFEELRGRVASGALSPASNAVAGEVEPPREGDVDIVPSPGAPAYAEARAAGLDALRRGRVASVVLAGGMATRFGGMVKGVVEAHAGRSFLSWKLGETARLAVGLGVEIPTALMTSFSTDEETRAHVRGLDVPEPIWFSQSVSLRLERDGSMFLDAGGSPSPYAPGHGDLVDALRDSGTVAALRKRGVDVVCVSNVDNLGARLDPVVIGAHLLGGVAMTCEVARKEGDMGGAPARVEGRLVLLETPRFPPGFDHDRITVFNTNTATIDLRVFDDRHDLSWLYVEKKVDGRAAVQLERLYHELASFVPAGFLEVPRSGPRGRFLPIKTPADLERSQPLLAELLAASPLDG
ncbi:MAG: UTP--glucose-1-phosphate uridylyltransferase [Thermoleophilia bacterium]|nr:UTP--glucose-1-phosphate uridylyltransferase [Thermoleophilia bacterium]